MRGEEFGCRLRRVGSKFRLVGRVGGAYPSVARIARLAGDSIGAVSNRIEQP
jgi:hypothetical protein